MIDAGLSSGQIARAMRRTRDSVCGQARRMGWKIGEPRRAEQRLPPFRKVATSGRRIVAAEDLPVTFTLRLDPDTYAEVVARARAAGRNRIEIIRDLIEWGLEAVAEAERTAA